MRADVLVRGISQLVTAEGAGPKRGAAMCELQVVEHAALAIAEGKFAWVGAEREWNGEAAETVDAGGCAVVPGLVDPHTHAVWAGDRLADFEARLKGEAYESILAAGGGIRSTIRATAAAKVEQLVALAQPRIAALVRSGATTIEVKSGYGFTVDAELRMLRAIHALAAQAPAWIVPTLLIHVPPANAAEREGYVAEVCATLIPTAAREKLAQAADVFVEKEAWSAAEAEQMLTAARAHGLRTKLHTEQFHRVGGLELGVRMGALSVDHLEACSDDQVVMLAASSTVATILPGVTLHLGLPAAPGRKLVDAGAAVAVGTDLNPGSSPLFSTQMALALAVRLNGLTAKEALIAGTANAACALGLRDAGRIEPGLPADFAVLHGADWRELVYTLGGNPAREVWIGGQKAAQFLRP
ncbi:MAG TPA: imidazolonepropionase [Acidobacteriaceae bacterium]|nr:imidazolonepropionase [Acidobacteriaceae bacterium]